MTTEYRVGYEWKNNHVTHSASLLLKDARDELARAEKNFSNSLLDAWIEQRTITPWKRLTR
jgi:hypothetical protein